MKILMLDSSTYGDDVNIDKYYELGEVKSYSTSTREEAMNTGKKIKLIRTFRG